MINTKIQANVLDTYERLIKELQQQILFVKRFYYFIDH